MKYMGILILSAIILTTIMAAIVKGTSINANYAIHDRNAWSVDCSKCYASMGLYETKQEAIEDWNTRSQEGLMERAEKVLTMAAILIDEYDTNFGDAYRRGRIKTYTDMYETALAQWKNDRGIK